MANDEQELLDKTGYENVDDVPPTDGASSPLAAANLAQAFVPNGAGAFGEINVGPISDKNLTGLLLQKANEIAPPRPEVMAKRQALQDAYTKLQAAQAYTPPPPDLGAYQFANAVADVPGANPNNYAGIKGNLALTEEQYKQQQLAEQAKQLQANTGIEAAKTGLSETGQDQTQSLDLLKQASLNDYRNAMMGARLNRPVKLPDGSQGLVNASTGQITMVADKFGNPVQGNAPQNGNQVSGGLPGGNAAQIDPEKASLATQLGVPIAPASADPTRGMTPQGRSTYTNKLQTQLQKNNESNQQIQDQLTNIDHFIDENQKNPTGGWRNLPVVNSIISATDPAYQTMNSLNKQFSVGPGMRPQGMRVTQGEWNVFRQATASTQNTPEANMNIANAMKAKLQRDLDYNNFVNDYTAVNGHSQLADNYFNQYMKDNPIFAPDASAKNNFELNPNRLSYSEYFAKKGLTGASPATSQVNPNPGSASLTPPAVAGNQAAPLGIRNNNPGNVRNGPNGTFAPAATPEAGIATTASNLLAYNDKHNINTVQDIISRWAPPIDTVTGKSNNTPAYIADVSKQLGVKPNQPLNMKDPETLYNLTTAIIKHENNGQMPYHPMQVSSAINTALQQNQKIRLAQASPQDIADALKAKGIIQ